MVQATREYSLLQLQPALLAACCLYLGLINSAHLPEPRGAPAALREWDGALAGCSGFGVAQISTCLDAHFGLLRDKELACRVLGSGRRTKDLGVTILFADNLAARAAASNGRAS